ncbi:MAG: hypothetical protein OIF50_13140 [Flavobacteriaceae bacterium]|nr:hypothetical protein [Flavobacteriaceae bacterium]
MQTVGGFIPVATNSQRQSPLSKMPVQANWIWSVWCTEKKGAILERSLAIQKLEQLILCFAMMRIQFISFVWFDWLQYTTILAQQFIPIVPYSCMGSTYKLLQDAQLPDKEIYDLLEDDTTNIWMATNQSLYRYDGYTYQRYRHPQQKGSAVFGLQKDKDNRIWSINLHGQTLLTNKQHLELFLDVQNYTKVQLASFVLAKDFL